MVKTNVKLKQLMAQRYIKSLIYLVTFTGIGYGLLLLTPTSQGTNPTNYSKDNITLTEKQKKNQILYEKLKEATVKKPIYLETSTTKEQ